MHSRRGACQLIGKKIRRAAVLGQDTRDSRLHLVAPLHWSAATSMTTRRHVCAQEALGPQEGKSELDQFGKLFLGGLDYSTTDSRATLISEKESSSLCSYELDVDGPKESVCLCKMERPAPWLSWTHSVPVGVSHCVSVRKWTGD
ncbi:hypothetical protein IscW_ISCW019516 [Ixodes scapularis]|uniref:Uncharacterized protein n=1 Tax=Ixodes scapularis TaxID=6945 RepID=B7PSA0_IXOSC|nr:hypothetical protein IscW_ISCW019516 [Ixodes scapularis]|eukprot:XP_002402118.1 hypothetical protein IscW_ISCW019516 [Ixodes scapularis]